MTRIKIKNPKSEIRNPKCGGSAIILAIVLTSLLAIIGVMFLLSSRVESVATSAISENKDLTLAVDTVVARISEDLVYDVSRGGIDPNQYADYPDPCNPFLASLEPYQFGTNYFWRQISDIYGNLYAISHYMIAEDLPDYNNTYLFGAGTPADADGDGVSDSMWVVVPNTTSSKGKPIFAAIRVIDNGGMLNVNTAKIFNPGSSFGSSLTEVNLVALSQRGVNGLPGTAASKLDDWRRGTELSILYEPNVIWRYDNPAGAFTPFDISDELKLRNRYMINHNLMATRIDSLWVRGFDGPLYVPRAFGDPLDEWFLKANYTSPDPCVYDYRHIATTYNYDRIIVPDGNKMFNINLAASADANTVYNAVRASLASSIPDATAAQIAANLIDYIDGPNYPPSDPRCDRNDSVTVVYDNANNPHYGFETPCVYISELAQNFFQPDPNEPNLVYYSYAIELFKPYWEDDEPNGWQLVINNSNFSGSVTPISWTGSRRFHVIANIDVNAPIKIDLNEPTGPNEVNLFDPNKFPRVAQQAFIDFNSASTIWLQRNVNGTWLTVDGVQVRDANLGSGWLEPNGVGRVGNVGYASHSFERDLTINRCFRRMWAPTLTHDPTVGFMNTFIGETVSGGGPYWTDTIQAHPANKSFTNVGEFGQLFYRIAYNFGGDGPWDGIDEPNMRINLALPEYQQVFKHLTVMDPCDHGWTNETRIKGRININTAPWYVLAQLPWVSYHTPNLELARAITDYRENTGGFRSIGELMNVGIANNDPCNLRRMDYYAVQAGSVFPALTPSEGTDDVFEERDAIFTRISNLVTVRSDVFTAYILVRIPASVVRDPITHDVIQASGGPQKRFIAIFDRSEVPAKKVKIVAIQMVPDPR